MIIKSDCTKRLRIFVHIKLLTYCHVTGCGAHAFSARGRSGVSLVLRARVSDVCVGLIVNCFCEGCADLFVLQFSYIFMEMHYIDLCRKTLRLSVEQQR